MSAKFELGRDAQTQIICLMVTDSKFLEQCVRRKIKPEYFSSSVRQTIARLAISHYKKFFAAPGINNLIETIGEVIASRSPLIREEDQEKYIAFLGKLEFVGREASANTLFFLDQIDTFIKRRIVHNLTSSLARETEIPSFDPNQALVKVRTALREVEERTGTSEIESLLESPLDQERDAVSRFNIPALDRALGGGLCVGSFILVLGYTSVGKSWCASHLVKHAARLGETPLLIDLERSNRQVRLRLRMCFTGMTSREIRQDSRRASEVVEKSMVKKSNVILLSDDEKSMRVDELPNILDKVEKKYGRRPRFVMIDSADDFTPPEGRYREKIERHTATYTWLKNYAKEEENDVCICTTTQAQRKAEHKLWLSSGNVGEDINKVRKATVGISINTISRQDGDFALEAQKGFARLFLFKNTDGPFGTRVWIKRDFRIGQFVLDWGLYNWLEYRELLREAASQESDEL